MLTKDFRNALLARLRRAADEGRGFAEINSGALHRDLGGYPGPSHRMPALCEAMRAEMRAGDRVVSAPPKNKGASLTIRYVLPRSV